MAQCVRAGVEKAVKLVTEAETVELGSIYIFVFQNLYGVRKKCDGKKSMAETKAKPCERHGRVASR